MIANQKKHKDIKIHKVDINKFKNAKKFNKYRSSKEIFFLANKTPLWEQKRSMQFTGLDSFVNNIEKKYSLKFNNNLVKQPKRLNSSQKLNFFKFNDLSTAKNFKGEEEKNNGGQTTSINVKIGKKTEKTNNNKIKHCKSLHINKYNQLNIFKQIKNDTHRGEDKKKKKDVKSKKNKIIKEEKKTDDDDENSDKKNGGYVKNKKCKIFCCLQS